MPVFMDDIATEGKAEHVRKGMNNCARMEKEKKISFGLKKQNIWYLEQDEKKKKK